MFELKWPTMNLMDHNNQLQFDAVDKETGKVVEVKTESLIFGSFSIILYALLFFFIFFTGRKKGDTYFKTLSESLEHSDYKSLIVIFVILFLIFQQIFFGFQGIEYSEEPLRMFALIFNYGIACCLILMLFVFPKNGKSANFSHYVIAGCLLLFLISNSLIIYFNYEKFFTEESIVALKTTCFTMLALCILCFLIIFLLKIIPLLVDKIFKKEGVFKTFIGIKDYDNISSKIVAFCEIVCMIFYWIFLIIFVNFPSLPKLKVVCMNVPK